MTAPCPFCGASPYTDQVNGHYRVRCPSCGYDGPSAPSEAEAGRAWDDLARALEKARASLKPCPFCGCSVSLDIGIYGLWGSEDYYHVVHPDNDCILSEVVSWSSSLDEVVSAWNERKEEGGIFTRVLLKK